MHNSLIDYLKFGKQKHNKAIRLHFLQIFGLGLNTSLYLSLVIGYILICLNPPENQWLGRVVAALLTWMLINQTVKTVRVLRKKNTTETIEHFMFVVYGALVFSGFFGIGFSLSEISNKWQFVSGFLLFFFLNACLFYSLVKK